MKIWDQAGIKVATPGSALRHVTNCNNYLFAGIQIVSSVALLNNNAVKILTHVTYNFKCHENMFKKECNDNTEYYLVSMTKI